VRPDRLPPRLGAGRVTSVAALVGLLLGVGPASGFSPGKASFSIRANGETIPYEVFALFLMPGQRLEVKSVGSGLTDLEMTADGVAVQRAAPGRWIWQAPTTSGLRVLRITDVATGRTMTLNSFVLVPATALEDGYLNGYRIGSYPAQPFRGLSAYRPPRGFVEVTEANRSTPVSPHFTLERFLCKQAGGPPQYLILRERLLLKLEYLLALVNAKGIDADTFAILSGFRTPSYNHAIGNVPNSRHQWGGAADIFVDESPQDGVMDDLNHDGKVDLLDAQYLYRLFEGASGSAEHRELTGGLGVYGSTSTHGPFVHVDARGYRARWGER